MSPAASSDYATAGARFFRCALHVNPYAYVVRQHKRTAFTDEDTYNRALVESCQRVGIEVIGVTDHYRISSGARLIELAEGAGLVAFPGFEAVSKDGVHFLCLFTPGTDLSHIDRRIGECGIAAQSDDSPVGNHDALELMELCTGWHAACIAAHVAAAGGLLTTLSGQSAMNAWRSEHLLACALPGPVKDAPQRVRPILENKNAQYRRDRPVAIINAQDVTDPTHADAPGASTAIKMCVPSYEALKLAFLDPGSRLRLASDPKPTPHTELVSVSWQGGFLDGLDIRFNENLNILIGGRGTGKSTVIESIRYALGLVPVGEQARRSHDALVKQVLRSGTLVTLRLHSPHPAAREYLVERTVANPPVVKAADGELLDLSPADIAPRLEVFGQHEISELARDPEQRTRLLTRFLEQGTESPAATAAALHDSRPPLLTALQRKRKLEQSLAKLPAVKETLKRYEDAGLEQTLRRKSELVHEEQLLDDAAERLARTAKLVQPLEDALPLEHTLLDAEDRDTLANRALITQAEDVVSGTSAKLVRATRSLRSAVDDGQARLHRIRERWQVAGSAVDKDYERILRKLQREDIDGAEFIRLRKQIEKLEAQQTELKHADATVRKAERERERALVAFETATAAEFRALERAAKRVSKQLRGRVRVSVTFQGNRAPLLDLLRGGIAGRLSEACEALLAVDDISLRGLAAACRDGPAALIERFNIPAAQAPRLASADEQLLMSIEELRLPATTSLELNVAAPGAPESWRALEDLSAGQKATAVLMLLLLESDAPLVIDQPEDDLDNRFITDGVVPQVRVGKRQRQFVFASHNANIPVLGDAELIAALTTRADDGHVRGELLPDHTGSLDVPLVKELVEEVLEGGRAAFELRRLKYGF